MIWLEGLCQIQSRMIIHSGLLTGNCIIYKIYLLITYIQIIITQIQNTLPAIYFIKMLSLQENAICWLQGSCILLTREAGKEKGGADSKLCRWESKYFLSFIYHPQWRDWESFIQMPQEFHMSDSRVCKNYKWPIWMIVNKHKW